MLITEGLFIEDLPYGSGSLGCSLSHIRLWKEAVVSGKLITIFEYDVIFAFYEKFGKGVAQRVCNDKLRLAGCRQLATLE
jgi:GR25 family glycosyltransferase involved in LPS biosynthesis